MVKRWLSPIGVIVLIVSVLLGLAVTGIAAAAGPGETGDGVIPPGFTKVTFVHFDGKPPQVIVEHGGNGKAPPLSGVGNVCSDSDTNGTDQCDSFKWDGQYWPGAAVTYQVNPSNSGDDGNFLAAIQASAQTWENDTQSVFDFSYGGTTGRKASSLRNRMDGNNDVTWDDLNKYQNPIAVTIFWYYTSTGVVVEADLVNNKNFPWASAVVSNAAYDVQNIDTHEFGHFLVLGDLYDASDSALTMYGYGAKGETQKQTLGLGDRLGIRTIYPAPVTTTGNIAGTVKDSSTNNPISGATVSTDSGQSTTTAADGSYSLTGVPTGTRIVTASVRGYSSASQGVSVTDGGTATANFSLTPAATATSVSVSSVTYATTGGKNGNLHLLITVALVDNLGNPVAGARASIDVFRNGSFYGSGSGTTGTSGTVTFQASNAPPGTYTTIVTNVTASGLTWDGVTPPNSFTKS